MLASMVIDSMQTGGHSMYRILLLSGLSGILLLGWQAAMAEHWANEAIPFNENAGCLEGPLAEFGRYVGNWKIDDEELQDDGVTWKEGTGARWDFVCLGNGTAIQDFWMPNDGGVGTNLRTYNKESQSWDIAWSMTGMSGFAHIQAKLEDDGNIVMMYKSPLPKPPRRITFFAPEENAWKWKLEMSFDEGQSWTEVYRIKATRL